jgi:hypothetical protein
MLCAVYSSPQDQTKHSILWLDQQQKPTPKKGAHKAMATKKGGKKSAAKKGGTKKGGKKGGTKKAAKKR